MKYDKERECYCFFMDKYGFARFYIYLRGLRSMIVFKCRKCFSGYGQFILGDDVRELIPFFGLYLFFKRGWHRYKKLNWFWDGIVDKPYYDVRFKI